MRFTGPTGALRALRSRVPADRWSIELNIGVSVLDWLEKCWSTDRMATSSDIREIRTRLDAEFLAWRFGFPPLSYRVLDNGDCAVIVRARTRGGSKELALVSEFGAPAAARRLAARAAISAGCDYVVRIGWSTPADGYFGLPGGGPILTWRDLADEGCPPLANWALSLGDVELF